MLIYFRDKDIGQKIDLQEGGGRSPTIEKGATKVEHYMYFWYIFM